MSKTLRLMSVFPKDWLVDFLWSADILNWLKNTFFCQYKYLLIWGSFKCSQFPDKLVYPTKTKNTCEHQQGTINDKLTVEWYFLLWVGLWSFKKDVTIMWVKMVSNKMEAYGKGGRESKKSVTSLRDDLLISIIRQNC